MILRSIKWLVLPLALIVSSFSYAVVPAWVIVPSESSLTFTATQNGAPVKGEFKRFSGNIFFDPNQLSESHVDIVVDVASVSDAYNKLAETLQTQDWFNVKAFPQAVFKANEFKKMGDKNYELKGTLMIRDKTVPVTLDLTLNEYSATKAQMKGSTVIKRSDFGVGQGEWADTHLVKDNVKIDFVVTAVKK